MDEVIVQSERVRNHSMMGMFGLDPNKLDFDYERHFPEHEFISTLPEVSHDLDRAVVHDLLHLPHEANLDKPRPVSLVID